MTTLKTPRGVLPLVLSVRTDLAPLLPGTAEEGEKVHAAELGSPEHARVTAELNGPPPGLRATLKVTDWLCFTLALAGVAETEKSTPVPFRFTFWGLPTALSVMVSVPD